MNHLLAKIIGRNGAILKVMSDERDLFDLPDLSDTHTYTTSYTLEDDEWYKLDNFLSRNYENDLIGTPFDSTHYNQITRQQYSKINYLCSKQGDFFLFQKMSSTRLLNKKWLDISGAPRLEINRSIIILNSSVDAAYNINDDILYFKNIARIKSMFRGIEELYREATQAEVDDFLNHNFISLAGTFTSDTVKTSNRKRIAIAIDILNQFTEDDERQIFQYIRSYCGDVPVNGEAFLVSTENHLKKILYGIEQRYYTTPLGNEKRLANSTLTLSSS
ncbi:hypothetical protein Metho_1319 [Methanomethylovorans hollandica DSM 15978]|uniref:DUF4868 domain-containing protein n=1 Tax=Methanomethylovorans hollandica (strain DSM 15978 / NBRC 107637 / DMS1) TaxID=867904 RepID=L0KWM4_METHD|nr:hypothetical protein [Methanomethylovorans hollandica]AGB49541.1 hypothetical protein Metho_1319 [Methanomethylovorans hollandica DSM 15978]